MPRLRLVVFSAFAGLLVLLFAVTDGDAQPDSVKQIAPGVWFREGDIQHKGHCNNVIIEMSDHLIVVDANFPSGARRVIEDARKLSPKPIKFVFDTHHHGDHSYGNPVWTKMGAVTIAYNGVAEEMKRYEPKRWQDTAKSRKDVGELNLTAPEPPQKTFTKSPYVMEDATRRVELHFFGWAHTRGDGFAWLPKDKVLCSGDAIVNGPYNYTADGNIGNWPKVIANAQKLDVKYLLPGHGPSGGKEVMAGQAQFFIELRKAVEEAAKSGKQPEEIAAAIHLPDTVKNWVGDGLKAQVKDAYNEVTQHKPAGDIAHP
jgi:cyclase